MDAPYPIRPIAESELPQYVHVGERAFNANWPSEQFVAMVRLEFEPERSLAAFDGDQIVGTTHVMSFELTVPGGMVPAAGVTGVSVLPSHRRRGVLSALMRTQLADIASGPEPVAALFASESVIYGRYGYGVACDQVQFVIKRGEAQLSVPQTGLALRLAEPRTVISTLAEVYDTVRATRPGLLSRSKNFWDMALADPEFLRDGSGPLGCVLVEDESGPRGYALYSVQPKWDSDGIPAQILTIYALFALDEPASTTLWADLLSRDLVGEVQAWSRPVDDPLLYQLPDQRRARRTYQDGLWLRLIDLPAALTRRRYTCPVDLVIEVIDQRLPANAGRWRLRAGGLADQAGPSCERTTAEPDLTLPVSALGAAYLGGTRLGGLAAAGLISEHRPGSVAALSAAMWWDPAPWAPTHF